MKILGYTDRLSAAPGETIEFKVSCKAESYESAIVRLRHGDLDENGPGFAAEPVDADIAGQYPGREQHLHAGSYVIVDADPSFGWGQDMTVSAWIQISELGSSERGIVSQWSNDRQVGWSLWVTADGDLAFRRGDGDRHEVIRTHSSISPDQWHFVAAVFDAHRKIIRLYQYSVAPWTIDQSIVLSESATTAEISALSPPPWLIGASHLFSSHDTHHASGHFNGKIEDPRIYRRALTSGEIESIQTGFPADESDADLLARWDFSVQTASDQVHDASGNHLHGRTVNMPMRAVTGHRWTGKESDHRNSAAEYGAIHFHDDDLDDARWETDFRLTIPPSWKSGVYAAQLSVDEFVDYVPFVVRPQPEQRANVAFLLPTLSYRAYANEHMIGDLPIEEVLGHGTSYEQAVLRYIVTNRLNSLYDQHTDGSGVCYSSRLRPMLNMRPRYNKPGLQFRHPHNLSCDLYMVDWLDHNQYQYDVITDDDLHDEGQELLAPYRAIIIGTHPEYWTWPMLNALRGYLSAGGRVMYLGGNGFYWVSSVDDQKPHIMEVRRGQAGSRRWTSAPGELHHSTTGELGGLWRHRGLPPQSTVGVGCAGLLSYYEAADGGINAYPYVRSQDSYDERVSFVFKGVEEEVIGDFGLHLGAAAGWEIDRADVSLGTPEHALVVATATPTLGYEPLIEEMQNGFGPTEEHRRNVRADITFFETPTGGAVFSVGSISWCGSLSHNGYDNSVSRITSNVLDRFMDDAPFLNPKAQS